jgi:malate dehydrogenase
VPITELMAADRIEKLVERTRKGGAEIVGLLKQGSAFYAPSAAATAMTAGILRNEHRVLPVSAMLEGEYDISGVYAGVPAKLGTGGIEEIIELSLTDEESAALKKSADAVREVVAKLE